MDVNYHFKTVLIGNAGVGKSALVLQYTDKIFTSDLKSTIGVDFKLKTLDMGRDRLVKLQIWDTGGQERFRTIVSTFYRGSDGLIIVYDLTNRKSFEDVTHWIREAEYNGFNFTNSSGLLVGNKTDLTTKRVVTFEEGQALAKQLAMPFIETSAKDTTNVDQAFVAMTCSMLELRKGNSLILEENYGSFQLPVGGDKDVQNSWYNYYGCC